MIAATDLDKRPKVEGVHGVIGSMWKQFQKLRNQPRILHPVSGSPKIGLFSNVGIHAACVKGFIPEPAATFTADVSSKGSSSRSANVGSDDK